MAGVFDTLSQDLRAVLRIAAGRGSEPTTAIIDSRTLRLFDYIKLGGKTGGEMADLSKNIKDQTLDELVAAHWHGLKTLVQAHWLEQRGFVSRLYPAKANSFGPYDHLARVKEWSLYGDADDVVPWDENTGLIADRYRKLGGSIELIAKPGVGHHPHGLDDPTPIIEFIAKHAAVR